MFSLSQVFKKPESPIKKPLYVRRDVLNAPDIIEWAKSVGFDKCVPPDEMHVTIVFSKKPIDRTLLSPKTNTLRIIPEGDRRKVTPLGDEGAVVLKFQSPVLQQRWQDFLKVGASWDYEGYQPHLTLTYHNPPDIDLKKIKPYDGIIILGPELYQALDEDWADKLVEKKAKPPKFNPLTNQKDNFLLESATDERTDAQVDGYKDIFKSHDVSSEPRDEKGKWTDSGFTPVKRDEYVAQRINMPRPPEPYTGNEDAWGKYIDAAKPFEREWKKQMMRLSSTGKITDQQGEQYGYYPDAANYGGYKPVPDVLYHITSARSKVESQGLRTRDETGQTGIGGGTSDTISTTDNLEMANQYLDGMKLARHFMKGDTPIEQMVVDAKSGKDSQKEWWGDLVKTYEGESSFKIDKLPSRLWDVMHGTITWPIPESFKDAPPEQLKQIMSMGAGYLAKEYDKFERVSPTMLRMPLSPERVLEQKAEFLHRWFFWRENAGKGPVDPLFFTNHWKDLIDTPDDEIALLKLKPKPGTHGYFLPAEHEWRVNFGDLLHVEEVVRKFNPNHDKLGLFASGTGYKHIFDDPIYTPIDHRLIDVKAKDRPLNDPKKVISIDASLPGQQYVIPYSATPFFKQLNVLQGTPDPMAVPVENYIAAREKLFNTQPVEHLLISDLIFTQTMVNKAKVEQNIKEKKDKEAFVVRYGGDDYVMDGHHMIVARALRGKKHIYAHVLKIKEQVKKFNPYHGDDGKFASHSVLPLKRDLPRQAEWLNHKAVGLGYRSADELSKLNPEVFMGLAQEWRKSHALEAEQKPGTVKVYPSGRYHDAKQKEHWLDHKARQHDYLSGRDMQENDPHLYYKLYSQYPHLQSIANSQKRDVSGEARDNHGQWVKGSSGDVIKGLTARFPNISIKVVPAVDGVKGEGGRYFPDQRLVQVTPLASANTIAHEFGHAVIGDLYAQNGVAFAKQLGDAVRAVVGGKFSDPVDPWARLPARVVNAAKNVIWGSHTDIWNEFLAEAFARSYSGKTDRLTAAVAGVLTSLKQGSKTQKAAVEMVGDTHLMPFVSFKDKMRDHTMNQMQLIASLHTSRLSNYGFVAEAKALGLTEYAISEQLDVRTCLNCRARHGKRFTVTDANDTLKDIFSVQSQDDMKALRPWPKQDKRSVAEFAAMSNDELVQRGWHVGELHPRCRALMVQVGKVPRIEDTPSFLAAMGKEQPLENIITQLPNIQSNTLGTDKQRAAIQDAYTTIKTRYLTNAVEHGIGIDQEGKTILEVKGTAKHIDFTEGEKKLLTNGVSFIHNHPNNFSLSMTDLTFAAERYLQQVIAIGTDGSEFVAFDIVRGASYKSTAEYFQTLEQGAMGVLAKYLYPATFAKEITTQEANLFHYHFLNTILGKFGVDVYRAKLGSEAGPAIEKVTALMEEKVGMQKLENEVVASLKNILKGKEYDKHLPFA